MSRNVQGAGRWLVATVMLALPVVLMYSSIRSLGELNETKSVYLRGRGATIAAHLENIEPESVDDRLLTKLAQEEPALVDLRIYDSPSGEPDDPVLQSLWRGEALFHTEEFEAGGEALFRMYLPFHVNGNLRIARIDLSYEAADYLLEHSRHHLVLSLLASLALVGFTVYFLWSERRAREFERKQIALEHLAQLGRMSAALAHEIRNPLGVIKGFVQLAYEKARDSAGGLLEPALGEVARLEKLVNDLLLYGRPRQPAKRATSWPQLSAQLETHARQAIGGRNIRFARNGDLDEFRTDPEILTQVLLNLIRNSVEAIDGAESGEVRIAAVRRESSEVRIRVEDDGPGLPEEVRAKLFEPFTTTKSNGTGLGLSIARRLTEALGGRISVGPRSPRGTRVELVLPE